MKLIFFDDNNINSLLPFTYTRPSADIRIGILKIREKWERLLNTSESSDLTRNYLSVKYPLEAGDDNLLINGSICPLPEYKKEILKLEKNQQLVYNDQIIAIRISGKELKSFLGRYQGLEPYDFIDKTDMLKIRSDYKPLKIGKTWEIFTRNREAFELDFSILTKDRKSQELSKSNQVLGKDNVFIEAGARIEFSMINATNGAVYIGKDAEVMEGCMIRGPFALCDHSVLKMGAKIYGPTTIGPHSKVGGEVNNSVIFGFSNKAHDGFLGNSVLGEWCNLGADTNNSNLKNNYGKVSVWNQHLMKYEDTGMQFCGLLMGDHSKTGINTMLNTGTLVGVNSNIFGAGFPYKNIPSFSWGGAEGFTEFSLEKAIEVASKVYERRNEVFDDVEKEILATIFEITGEQRKLTH